MIRWVVRDAHRVVAMCGDAEVGAVFPSSARRVRWRAWVTKNMNPVEQTARDVEEAKREVEARFNGFLELAKLRSVE